MAQPSIKRIKARLANGDDDDDVLRPPDMPKWRWRAEQQLGISLTEFVAAHKERKVSDDAIGEVLGVSRTTVRKIRLGRTKV